MRKKAFIPQPALFNLDSPPVKALPPKLVIAPPVLDEAAFYEVLHERAPGSPRTCLQCGGSYLSISYHILKVCSAPGARPPELQSLTPQAPAGGPVLELAPVSSPLSQDETPQREPSENIPGAFAYKSKGVPEGDKMHPNYRPPSREVAPEVAPEEEPQEEPKKEERPPHWWHWSRPSTPRQVTINGKTYEIQSKNQESYTPPLAVRRRSIPSIACALYHRARTCYLSKDAADNAPPGYVKVNALFYESDKRKVERLVTLLIFCGVEESKVRGLAREAWQDAKEENYQAWSDNAKTGKKGIGRGLLRLLGYELADGECDGYFDTVGASFAAFAEAEGMKGR